MSLADRALPIPEDVTSAEGEVVELARVWWNRGLPAMVIRAAMHEPRVMGAILAEMAWQFSKAYADQHGLDRTLALRDIRDAWIEGCVHDDKRLAEGSQ